MRATPPSSGFTLIEVLLSLWIMSIMALMSWQSIDAMVRVREKSLSSVSDLSTVQTALAQWQTDLDQAVTSNANTSIPGLDWDGQTIKWVRTSSAPWDALGDPGLWVVAWTIRMVTSEEFPSDGTAKPTPGLYWLRWQSPAFKTPADLSLQWQAASNWGKNASAETKVHETLVMPLQNWQLFYYRLNTWSNPLSSTEASGNTLLPNPNPNPNINASNPSSTTPNSSSLNPSSINPNSLDASSMPDGIRLKLFLSPATPLGQSSTFEGGQANTTPSSSLTMDWVRPNFSGSR